MIIFDFTFYLTLAVVVTGVIALLDMLFWAKKRRAQGQKAAFDHRVCALIFSGAC